MSTSTRNWALLILVAGAVLGIDQWVKLRVLETLADGGSWRPIPAISEFIRFSYSENRGAAFGMFPAGSNLFLIIAIITVIVFIVMYPRLPSHGWMSRVSIALIVGGALSNALDRVLRGFVVDYVHVQVAQFSNISNLADHAITVGVVLLMIDQWRAEQREMAEKAQLEAEAEAAAANADVLADAPTPAEVHTDDPSETNPALG